MLFRTVRAKGGSKGSRLEIWISRMKNVLVNYKKLKIKNFRNFLRKILVAHSQSLQKHVE